MLDPILFEKIVIKKLFSDEQYRSAILPYLNSKYFINDQIVQIVKSVQKFQEKFGTFPTMSEYRDLYQKKTELVEMVKSCMMLTNTESENGEWNGALIIEKTEEFFKQKMLFEKVIEIKELINSTEPDFAMIGRCIDNMAESNSFSFDTTEGLDIDAEIENIYDYFHSSDVFIPTGFNNFDKHIGGGSYEKTLNILMAQPNLGKTLMKCAMCANNLLQGVKVVYYTFEMSEKKIAERILANMMFMSIGSLKVCSKETFFDAYERIKKYIKNNLIIKEFPTKGGNTNSIRHSLKKLREKKNFVPQIVYIDYLQIMQPNNKAKGSNSYTDSKEITEELRGLAVEMGIAIWTSNQVNRSGMNNLDVDFDDMSDSIAPAMTADTIISLTQNDELRSMGLIQCKILKNRNGLNKIKFMMKVDYNTMRIEDHNEDDENPQFVVAQNTAIDNIVSLQKQSNKQVKF